MRALSIVTKTVAFSAVFALAACEAGKPEVEEDFSALAQMDQKSDAFSATVKIVGSLDYGQTSAPVSYRNPPKFRAFKFAGDAGDKVTVDVRSPNGGDAVAWVLNDSFQVLAANDDASVDTLDSHIEVTLTANKNPDIRTYYVLFRDYDLRRRAFTVALSGPAADPLACQKDSDCTKILGGCCKLGWVAVRSGAEAAYFDALECPDDLICAQYVPNPIDDVAQCNNDTNKCELVDPLNIRCQGFSINPHFCPVGYQCIGEGLAYDVPGVCRTACATAADCTEGGACVEGFCAPKTCGGLGALECPGELACIDDLTDDCDVDTGGRDCGSVCSVK